MKLLYKEYEEVKRSKKNEKNKKKIKKYIKKKIVSKREKISNFYIFIIIIPFNK